MPQRKYDVVVVGSGAGGATAASALVNRGLILDGQREVARSGRQRV